MMKKQDLFKIIIDICNNVLLSEKDSHTIIHLPEFTAEEWKELLAQTSMHGMLPILIHFFEILGVSGHVVKYFNEPHQSL